MLTGSSRGRIQLASIQVHETSNGQHAGARSNERQQLNSNGAEERSAARVAPRHQQAAYRQDVEIYQTLLPTQLVTVAEVLKG